MKSFNILKKFFEIPDSIFNSIFLTVMIKVTIVKDRYEKINLINVDINKNTENNLLFKMTYYLIITLTISLI